MDVDLAPNSDEMNMEVSTELLSKLLGKQGMLSDAPEDQDERAHWYLAAIALEGMNRDDYDINRTVREFVRNSTEAEVSLDE